MVFKHCLTTSSLTVFMLINFAQSASAMYDPMLGRFASRDPIGYVGSPGLLYEFVNGNAATKTDPTGLICAECKYVDRKFTLKRKCGVSGKHVGREFTGEYQFGDNCKCCKFQQFIFDSFSKAEVEDGPNWLLVYEDIKNSLQEDCVTLNDGTILCYGKNNGASESWSADLCSYTMLDMPGFMANADFLKRVQRVVNITPPYRLRYSDCMTFGHRVTNCAGKVLHAEVHDLGCCTIYLKVDFFGKVTEEKSNHVE